MGVHKKDREFEEFAKGHVRKSTCIMLVVFSLMIGAFIGNVATSLMFQQKQAAAPHATGTQGSPSVDPKQSRLEAAVAANPDDAHAWSALGHYYFDHQMPKRAIAAYQKSLNLSPNHPGVWSDLGVMYRRTGQSRKAIEAFDSAAALDPKHITARFNKGIVLLYDLENKEAALAAWRSILAIDPEAKAPDGRPMKEVIREAESK